MTRDDPEDIAHDDILIEQFAEYQLNGRWRRELLLDANIPGQTRGRIVPQKETGDIRDQLDEIEKVIFSYKRHPFFVTDIYAYADDNGHSGYRLVHPENISVMMFAGNGVAWVHFRDAITGTYITLSWDLDRYEDILTFDQSYANKDEAIVLINEGMDAIELGHFDPDSDVTYPFPE